MLFNWKENTFAFLNFQLFIFNFATSGQFHQHFISAFAIIFLRQWKVWPLLLAQKSFLYEKAARKILVKLTPRKTFNEA
jgi:hypothetical protein